MCRQDEPLEDPLVSRGGDTIQMEVRKCTFCAFRLHGIGVGLAPPPIKGGVHTIGGTLGETMGPIPSLFTGLHTTDDILQGGCSLT